MWRPRTDQEVQDPGGEGLKAREPLPEVLEQTDQYLHPEGEGHRVQLRTTSKHPPGLDG